MLKKIAAAGDAGVPSDDLIHEYGARHRYGAVRDQLEQDGLVTTIWEKTSDPKANAIDGEVCVFRLKDDAAKQVLA